MVRGAVAWGSPRPRAGRRGAEDQALRRHVPYRGRHRLADDHRRSVLVSRGKPEDRLVQPVIGVEESRLPKRSRALCDQVRTLDRSRIRRTAGALSPRALRRIDRGLILHLRLESYMV